MPWVVAAAGVSAVGGIAGSLIQSKTTKDAQSAAIAAQQAAEERARQDLLPYNTQGQAGLTASSDLLGLNGPDAATAARGRFQTSPGYQFAFDQGLRAVDAGAAASGMARSGATLKAEQTFGTGLADQEFTNYYNRLFNLANLGENAAATNRGQRDPDRPGHRRHGCQHRGSAFEHLRECREGDRQHREYSVQQSAVPELGERW